MRWIKRITVTLLTLLVFITITVSLTLLILDDENYRNITISLVEKFTDLKLKIQGPFSLDISSNPTITASAVQLHNSSNNLIIDIESFKIAITLRSLLFNNLRITNLQLNNINVTLKQSLFDNFSSIRLTQEIHEIESTLLPIFEKGFIQNLKLNIEQKNSTLNNYASLSQLTLGFDKTTKTTVLKGDGQINKFGFTINGEFGSLSNILMDKFFPVNANIQIANMNISINGGIEDPLHGTGVSLKFSANTKDFLKVFRVNNNIPFLGALNAHANISGNLPNIAIEDIKFNLKKDSKNYIAVSGDIAEIKTGNNAKLIITSKLNDQTIINWIKPEKSPQINTLTANTIVNHNQRDYVLNNIQIESLIEDDVKLNITGSTRITDISAQPFKDIKLLISANTDTAKSLQNFISKDIPDLGPIELKAQLNSEQDYFVLNDISISAGDPKKLYLKALGKIQKIIPNSDKVLNGVNLKLFASIKNITSIKNIIKTPLPDLRDLTLNAELYDNNDLFALKNIVIKSETGSKEYLKITGVIANIKNGDGLNLDGELNINTKKLLQAITDTKTYPELGKTKGSFTLLQKNGDFTLTKINIETSKSQSWKFTANGEISHLLSDFKSSIKTTSQITNWDDLKKIIKKEKLDFKPESGSGELSGNKKSITFYNTFIIGKSKFNFGISAMNKNNRYEVTTFLESPEVYLSDFGIKPKDTTSNKTNLKEDDNTNKDIISDKTLPFDKLKIIDLTANLKIDKFSGNNNYLNALDLKLKLYNGELRLYPAILNFSDGNVSLDIGLSANTKHDSYIKLDINDVNLGSIMSQLQKTPIIKGSLNTTINLISYGDTFQEIATNSSGDITVVGENIEVLRKYTNLIASDTLGWASSSVGLSKQYSKWDCSIFKFDVANSEIKSDVIIADGKDMRLKGDLSLNLKNETIEMSLWPQQKNTIWLNASPVTISGPIRNPRVNALTVGTSNIARAYGELILAPGIFIPLRALGYINTNIITLKPNTEGPCQKLEKELLKEAQQQKDIK
ncbi:MAG: AsmA family protein [Gammaproteobacteria bacterium]